MRYRLSLTGVLAGALLSILVLSFSSCATASQSAIQRQHQALLSTARSLDLAMTLAGGAYRSGVFGAVGSAHAESVRGQLETAAKAASAAIYAWESAIDAGTDPAQYQSALSAALDQIDALIPKPVADLPAPTQTVRRNAALAATTGAAR